MFAYTFALVERAKAELALVKSDRRGVTALEYGLIAAAIATVLGTAFGHLTGGLTTLFTSIGTTLSGG